MDEAKRFEISEMCRFSAFVVLTHDIIEAGRSSRGGWSEAQLKLIGVEWPPQPGWKATAVKTRRRIIGAAAVRFIEIRDEHL